MSKRKHYSPEYKRELVELVRRSQSSCRQIAGELELRTNDAWVQEQAQFFQGSLVGVRIVAPDSPVLNVVSVHSPACEYSRQKWAGRDMSHIKLAANPEIWCKEIP